MKTRQMISIDEARIEALITENFKLKKEIESLRLILSHQPDLINRYNRVKIENEKLKNQVEMLLRQSPRD